MTSGITDQETWLTIGQVAERLTVDPRTVRRWIAAGKLAAGRAGPRIVRIRSRDLAAFEARFLAAGTARRDGPQESPSDRDLAADRAKLPE